MISVVIPIHNASAFLNRCLSSLLSQTEEDWEAILVNDGSTDESGDICERFVAKDNRFRYCSQPNGGVSSARNTGIQQVRGEWISFVDADDYLPETALSTLLKAAEGKPDFVIGGYEIYDQNGVFRYGVDDRISESLDRDDAIALMYKSKYYNYLGFIWAKLFRTDIIRNNSLLFNPKIYYNEDRLFITQYIALCDRIELFTEPVYHYIEHLASATCSARNTFNDKYLTDFDAMILMRETVARSSPVNYQNATEGIACSYWEIQHLMNTLHANSIKKVFSLHRKLYEQLKLKEYCRLVIRPFFQKLRKKLFLTHNAV